MIQRREKEKGCQVVGDSELQRRQAECPDEASRLLFSRLCCWMEFSPPSRGSMERKTLFPWCLLCQYSGIGENPAEWDGLFKRSSRTGTRRVQESPQTMWMYLRELSSLRPGRVSASCAKSGLVTTHLLRTARDVLLNTRRSCRLLLGRSYLPSPEHLLHGRPCTKYTLFIYYLTQYSQQP